MRARRRGTLTVNVRSMGTRVSTVRVAVKGAGVAASKVTNAAGTVTFSLTPRRQGRLTISVADVPNMLGCNTSRNVARASRSGTAGAGGGGSGPSLTGRPA